MIAEVPRQRANLPRGVLAPDSVVSLRYGILRTASRSHVWLVQVTARATPAVVD